MMSAENLLACVSLISWAWQNFVGMSMEKFCGYGKILWVWDFGLWNIFVGYVMLDHGNFCDRDFGHGKFSVVILIMRIFWTCVYNVIFGVGIFLVMWFWYENFLDVIFSMEWIYIFFFVGMEIWNGMRFFCWHGISFFDILMMGQTLFCRISKVEVAFKCWKAHGKYCLQISGILLMMRASKLFWRLYRIKNPMSTRIFRYSLLCQNVFRTPCVLSIFRALVK